MTLIFERLECIDDPEPHETAFNMAADEALLDGLGVLPLLRIYRWRRPAVSFGYFDHAAAVLPAYPGRDPVRRWTGGGIVEHGSDFTYSLMVPRTHSLTGSSVGESYRVLHETVARALAAAGTLATTLDRGATPIAGGHSRACFVNAVPHDLLLAGRKVAGAAQRRTRRGWIHQGSIQLGPGAEAIYERLRSTLPAALSAEVQPRTMRAEETTRARVLATGKYGTEAWLHRV